MSVFADVEQFLERVFERTSARVFRTRLQPVQLQRRVERAMELARTVEDGRPVVPDAVRVRLSPADLRSAAGAGGADALATRLAEAALDFARRNRFHVGSRPTVAIVADPRLADGQIEIETSRTGRAPAPASDPATARPGEDAHLPTDAGPAGDERAADEARPADGDPSPRAAGPPESGPWVEAGASIRGGGEDPSRTMVFRRPAPAAPRASLREIRRDGTERSVQLEPGIVALGRAADNDVVVDDPRVSRHHGRLHVRRGALVYTDLGSTNGSRVNGIRVDEIALGYGDRLELGDTVLLVETLPG